MLKRNRRHIWYGVILFIGVCFFSACGKPEIEFKKTELDDLTWFEECNVDVLPLFEKTGENDSHWVYLYDDFVTTKGRFRFSQERFVLEFCDWMTDEVYPLCIKANCNHNDNSCNAYFAFKEGAPKFLYCDGQYLYYAYSGGAAATEWYRQNMDGSDRIKLFSVSESLNGSRAVYKDEMVYFVTLVYETNKNDNGDTGVQTGVFKYHIYSANLNTGEAKPLACEFSGNIEEDLISVELLGVYEEQLLVDYSLTTSLEPLDSLRRVFLYDVTDGTMTGVESWDSNLNLVSCPSAVSDGVYAVLELDLETERFIGNRAYYEGEISVFDLNNTCRYVLEKQGGLDYNLAYLDGKLFYSKGDKQSVVVEAYDISSGEKIVIPEQNADLILDGEVGEWFYGRILSENNTFISFHLLKTDYYNGERNLILEQ